MITWQSNFPTAVGAYYTKNQKLSHMMTVRYEKLNKNNQIPSVLDSPVHDRNE